MTSSGSRCNERSSQHDAVETSPSSPRSLCCPECDESFTYLEREGQGGHLPCILSCGHRLCFSCLTNRLGSHNADKLFSDEQRELPLAFSCFVCGQLQKAPVTFSDQDIVHTFPVDSFTVGTLVVLGRLGKEYLPQLYKPLRPASISVQSLVSDTVTKSAHARTARGLTGLDFCKFCRTTACDWHCEVCDFSFCFLCSKDHDARSCGAEMASIVPYDVNGGLVMKLEPCREHNHHRSWHCVTHEHYRSRFSCFQPTVSPNDQKCQFADKEKENLAVIQELNAVLPYIKQLICATDVSLQNGPGNIKEAQEKIVSLHKKDQENLAGFFSRIVSSAMFSNCSLKQQQLEVDGKRLSFLCDLQDSMRGQLKSVRFLISKWDYFTSCFNGVMVNMVSEQQLLEKRLLNFSLWHSDQLSDKRVDTNRFTEATWENGLPKGLRTIINKSRTELSVTDYEIGAVVDAKAIERMVKSTKDKSGRVVRYELMKSVANTQRTVPTAPLKDEAIERLRRTVFSIDGLIPRNWFPEQQKLIDRNPMLCNVTFVENPPETLWLRTTYRIEEYDKMVKFLEKFCADARTVPQDLDMDEVYATYSKTLLDNGWDSGRRYDKKMMWMRVKIMEKAAGNDGSYKCFFVDFGRSARLFRGDLKKLPRQMQVIKPFAHRAKLSGFVPYWRGEKGRWAPKSREHVHTWLGYGGIPFVILDDVDKDNVLVVDMWSDASIASLKEFLMVCAVGTVSSFSDALDLWRSAKEKLLTEVRDSKNTV